MTKPQLQLDSKYTVVLKDRSTFVGVYKGSGGKTSEMFQVGTEMVQREVDSASSTFVLYRDRPPRLHISQFAKAHWALLFYIETAVVGKGGVLDPALLRCNPMTHLQKMTEGQKTNPRRVWDARSGTAIKGAPGFIRGYDDLDCINDLVESGLVSRHQGRRAINEEPQVWYSLTPKGWEMSGKVRRHIAENQGNYEGL